MSLENQCLLCESTTFENIDGFYFCLVCGSKSQNVCDIELSDDDQNLAGVREIKQPQKQQKKKVKDEIEENKSIDQNFSTYEVFTYILKRQCEDLVKLGVNPILKDFVLRLWSKYLQKLEIAFIQNNISKNVNTKNVKWKRDKEYFEIYNLNECLPKIENEERMELDADAGADAAGLNCEKLIDRGDEIMEKKEKLTPPVRLKDEPIDSDDYENYDELSENSDQFHLKKRIFIDFVKFEWIRMPHTIALINLALLAVKSQILITDLVRFIHNGSVSYFNIDEFLPESLKFVYGEDARLFNMMSLPNTDFLRYLTSKLGNYLGLDQLELIEMKYITTRFIIDLNLPDQLASIVNLLLQKVEPIDKFDLKISQYENIEAIALVYIYAAILILFIYDSNNDKKSQEEEDAFSLNDWIKEMQTCLVNLKKEISGCNIEEVLTIEDIKSLKLEVKKHRHNLDTKPYIAQYRRKVIINALSAPLRDFEDKIKHGETDQNLTNSLFYIKSLAKAGTVDFQSKSLSYYLNEEKLNLLELNDFKSKNFNEFLETEFNLTELRGKYLLGFRATALDWLLDVFNEIAQTNFNKMFNYSRRLLNTLKTPLLKQN